MSDQLYNWKRFWCPRTGAFNLSDGGYLSDPDDRYGGIYNPNVVSFETITDIPCLILLGEPGIGKTHAMNAEKKALETEIQNKDDKLLWLNFHAYGNEVRLIHDLFESPTFKSWVDGEHYLHIFLDSLDECLLQISNLAALLTSELQKYPIERLSFRIACRTAEWPGSLESGLIELWGDDSVKAYELVPLRRVDVEEAANANSLNAEAFLCEIDRMEAVPLAIKPITLKFLLNTYFKSKKFPSKQSELYFQGCRLLCEESNEGRRDAHLTGQYDADQRMGIAARIAAVTIFANRYAVWTDVDWGNVPEEDIAVQSLLGGKEKIHDTEFEVNDTAIREALATGLFSSRGPNRMGFAHQTYAEFLAAHYLVQHKMTMPQMMSIIVHSGDPDRKLVPQLYQSAAWLAGMLPAVFHEIMETEPEVLLRSDVATSDEKDKERLVENLLQLVNEDKIHDRISDIRQNYRKLDHPGLAMQLQPYICDGDKKKLTRRVAIEITEACNLTGLQAYLLDIVFDKSEDLMLRERAAATLVSIANDVTKAKMKPLAVGEAGDDPDDQLKGFGLQAVWPNHITAEELFAVLTHPKRDNFVGRYYMFLVSELTKHLQPSDMLVALKWVEEQGAIHDLNYAFDKVVDDIMLRSWENLGSPSILGAFAEAALSHLKKHGNIRSKHGDESFREILIEDDHKRRLLLDTMVKIIKDPEKDSLWLVCSPTPVAIDKDLHWIMEHFHAEESDNLRLVWINLIKRVFNFRNSGHVDVILNVSQNNPTIADAFEWLLRPVELDSPQALKMREDFQKRQEWAERRTKKPLLEPPPAERIKNLLEKCESGDSAAWWQLVMEMSLEPDSRYYGSDLDPVLTDSPGWKGANTLTKARIIRAAERYILEQDPHPDKWLGKNILYRPAFAGYKALRLLYQENNGAIFDISPDVWKKWSTIILAYPTPVGDRGKYQKELLKIAYQYAPHEIIETLLILIDKENKEHDHIYITRNILGCWDGRLSNALLEKVEDTSLKPECMGCLLRDLLEHDVTEALGFAKSLVPSPIPSNTDVRKKALIACRTLMTYTKDACWSFIWPIINQNPAFGTEIVEAAMSEVRGHEDNIGEQLTEDQLSDLFIWLEHNYPHTEDPEQKGANGVAPRERLSWWRNNLLTHLKMQGTPEACEAIRKIIHEFPRLDWLKWTLLEAQNITRRSTWVPPHPNDILKMAKSTNSRLVQGGNQLLDVLIESLRCLEAKLQGETPASQFLWNQASEKKGLFIPKDENAFSDFVKLHLEEDLKGKGIIVNREVQIHRGERTDIHVDAITKNSTMEAYDSISVIIEVKGCWNKNLKDAMETQLVSQYLKDNRCQHGLYLVGWFYCDKWDKDDYKKGRTPKIDISEAQQGFDDQAKKLSQQDVCVKAIVLNTVIG